METGFNIDSLELLMTSLDRIFKEIDMGDMEGVNNVYTYHATGVFKYAASGWSEQVCDFGCVISIWELIGEWNTFLSRGDGRDEIDNNRIYTRYANNYHLARFTRGIREVLSLIKTQRDADEFYIYTLYKDGYIDFTSSDCDDEGIKGGDILYLYSIIS